MTKHEAKLIIKNHSFLVKKRFGQNFLTDSHVINKIVGACGPSNEDLVIEIGPGLGCLTKSLAEKAGKVYAVEIDKSLFPVLNETLIGFNNVKLIQGDILKTDINNLINCSGMKNIKVAANLPYNIATAVIAALLEKRYPIETITIMVQKEAADRIMALPGTKNYGSLSLFINYYSEPYLVANVPKNCFIPRPNVDSAVVRLKVLKQPPINITDEKLFFNIIKTAFSQRRKTLANCLANSPLFNCGKDELYNIISSCGFERQIRGEAMSLRDFEHLSQALGVVTQQR